MFILVMRMNIFIFLLYYFILHLVFIVTIQVEDVNTFTCVVCVSTDIAGLICSDIIKRYINTENAL